MADLSIAGVELGGTKTVIVLGRRRAIVERVAVPTTTPAATLAAVRAQLAAWPRAAALGIASFGPIRLDRAAADYGTMLATTKGGWTGADVVGALADIIVGPVALHTDVTAAALAEAAFGAAVGIRDLAYVTIGTGIGVGLIANGEVITGALHPEAGHIRVRRVAGDGFAGICPFHGDCLEGLASGPAISARAGVAAELLTPDDPAWTPIVDALAEACATWLATLACARIVIGGGVGVGQGAHLLPSIRAEVLVKLAGYLDPVSSATIDRIIVPALLGADAGPIGALMLGERALANT